MRAIFLTLALVLASGSAHAGSITPIEQQPGTGDSIQSETCPYCPPATVANKPSYVVPTLKPGTQTVEIRQIDGEHKVVRTEAWMGGSPVVFISKATPEALAAANAPANGIDLMNQTGAVQPAAPAPKPLDTSSFDLRLN